MNPNAITISSAWIPGATGPSTNVHIVRQIGTRRFVVSDGTRTGQVELVASTTLAEGEACLKVQAHGSNTVQFAETITAKRDGVMHVKTFDKNRYGWAGPGATANSAGMVETLSGTPMPIATVLPSISGTPRVGQAITFNEGTWTGSPSLVGTVFKNGFPFVANDGYVLQESDFEAVFTYRVAGTNAGGTVVRQSAVFGPIQSIPVAPPVNTVAPSISGSPQIGQAINFNEGTWTGSPTLTTTVYRNGISVSLSDGYVLQESDLNATFTYHVSATNAGGTVEEDSATFGPVLGAGIITAIEAVNDVTIAFLSYAPVMQTNGNTLKITADRALTAATFDPTKITVNVTDRGWGEDGNEVAAVSRTIKGRSVLFEPRTIDNLVVYQPEPNVLYVVLDDEIYNQDATWKTTITSVAFQAGWVTAAGSPAPAETKTSVTRSDTKAYEPFPVKVSSLPYQRLSSNVQPQNVSFEVVGQSRFGRNLKMFACVEAWVRTFGGVDGPLVRTSTYGVSSQTPTGYWDGGNTIPKTPGYQYASYELTMTPAAVGGGSLPDGEHWIRYRVKPWIGPAYESIVEGKAWPTEDTPAEFPVYIDNAGNFTPLYGVIANDPTTLPSGKTTLVASNTTVGTVNVTGISTTMQGAIDSGVVYANMATLATAVRRINNSATSIAIAGGNYQRPAAHTTLSASFPSVNATNGSISGAVAVLEPVTGSALGSNTGSYAVHVSMSSTTNFPAGPGWFEIRSVAGYPTDNVRLRGLTQAGAAPTSKAVPRKTLIRGITVDGSGTTTTGNIVLSSDSTGGANTASRPSATTTLVYTADIDCKVVENEAAGGANTWWTSPGHRYSYRRNHAALALTRSISGNVLQYNSQIVMAGGNFVRSASGGVGGEINCVVGCKFFNVGLTQIGANTTNDAEGSMTYGPLDQAKDSYILQNCKLDSNQLTGPLVSMASDRPVKKGFGARNVLVLAFGTTENCFAIGNDYKLREMRGIVFEGISTFCKSPFDSASGRTNWFYQDQGYARIDKTGVIRYCAIRNWNMKGWAFPVAALIGNGYTGTHNPNTFYYWGHTVSNGTHVYQAIRDVPANANIALTDTTYWVNTNVAPGASFGYQPVRQGNMAALYHVGFKGNVGANTFNGLALSSGDSGYGLVWGPDEANKYTTPGLETAQLFENPSNDDYRPLASGPLMGRVPAGAMDYPIDLEGRVLNTSTVYAAGAVQR